MGGAGVSEGIGQLVIELRFRWLAAVLALDGGS